MQETLASINNIGRRIMEKMGINFRAEKAYREMGDGEIENIVFSLSEYDYKGIEEYAPSLISVNNETQVMTFFYDGIPYYSNKMKLFDIKRIKSALLKLERNLHKLERYDDDEE